MRQAGRAQVWIVAAIAAGLLAIGGGLWLMLRSDGAKGYSQASPDDTLRTAVAMVKNGDAAKVPTLIHADKPELRAVLKRLGEFFASVQQLAYEINRVFPEDVAKLKAQFARELADGTAPSIMEMLSPPGSPGGPGTAGNPRGFDAESLRKRAEAELAKRQKRGDSNSAPVAGTSISIGVSPSGGNIAVTPNAPAPAAAAGGAGKPAETKPATEAAAKPAPTDPEKQFQALASRLLADPFSWLTENEKKLSTEKIADDQAAVLFDGKPVPPLGLTMREVGGKWYFVLPLNSPGIGQYMPQTRHEWSIIGSLIRVLDNAVKDVTTEVQSGKVRRMDKLAESVGEKAFIPGAMVAVMYGKEMDVRQRREKAVSAFKKRWSAWSKTRDGDDPVVLGKLYDAVNKLAVEELDVAVRQAVKDPQGGKLPDFAKMNEGEVSLMVEGWLNNRQAKVSLTTPPLDGKAVDEAVAKIEAWFSGKVQRKKK